MTSQIERLQVAIGYKFHDMTYLEAALRHRSVGKENNERLEFLGDSILGFLIADQLFQLFPEMNEGKLTRSRAELVKKSTLSELSKGLGIGESIVLGPGEMKSGGYRRESILADALEAMIGAIYLDGGIGPAREAIMKIYGELLGDHQFFQGLDKDPKTRLQEYLQARNHSLPIYTVISSEGPDHRKSFRVECKVIGEVAFGNGESIKYAEQNAAENLLKLLELSK